MNGNISIDKENIKVVLNVKMLGVHTENKFNFKLTLLLNLN